MKTRRDFFKSTATIGILGVAGILETGASVTRRRHRSGVAGLHKLFGRRPAERWPAQRIWAGENLPSGHAMTDVRTVDVPTLNRAG
jgi:hypothetical protein